MILDLAIYLFAAVELANALLLYFKPDFPYGNSMAVFKGWEKSKMKTEEKLLLAYLVRWVGNCKLIFISLLLSIALMGNDELKLVSITVTILCIGLYFISLHPIITRLDQLGEIQPAGYSKQLALTIAGFMAMFTLAIILHLTLAV